MELRHHLKMTFEGKQNWPPHWMGPYSSTNPLPRGEVGILKEVYTKAANTIGESRCYLVIEHQDREYFASLRCDDRYFLVEVCRALQGYVGALISDVGSVDIP
jgi:hypothetical protein